jgi:hypothetical protein
MLYLFKLSIINHLVDIMTKRNSSKKRTKFSLVGMCSKLFMKEKIKFKNKTYVGLLIMIYCSKNKIWFEKWSARFTMYNKSSAIQYQALGEKNQSCELTSPMGDELKSWAYDDE